MSDKISIAAQVSGHSLADMLEQGDEIGRAAFNWYSTKKDDNDNPIPKPFTVRFMQGQPVVAVQEPSRYRTYTLTGHILIESVDVEEPAAPETETRDEAAVPSRAVVDPF